MICLICQTIKKQFMVLQDPSTSPRIGKLIMLIYYIQKTTLVWDITVSLNTYLNQYGIICQKMNTEYTFAMDVCSYLTLTKMQAYSNNDCTHIVTRLPTNKLTPDPLGGKPLENICNSFPFPSLTTATLKLWYLYKQRSHPIPHYIPRKSDNMLHTPQQCSASAHSTISFPKYTYDKAQIHLELEQYKQDGSIFKIAGSSSSLITFMELVFSQTRLSHDLGV